MLRDFPFGRTVRTRAAVVAALSAALLAAAFSVPGPSVASGDDEHAITHRKTQLEHRIAGSRGDVDEISRRLMAAQDRLDASADALASARANSQRLQAQVQRATLRDRQMQATLDRAVKRLREAKADYAAGRRTVASQRDDVAGYAVASSAAQLSQLSTLNLLVNAGSPQAVISEVQGSNSALDRQLTDLQRLQANQVLLHFTEQRVQAAADQVAADRQRAAANLATKQRLEAAALVAEAAVQQQFTVLTEHRASLAAAKAAELSQLRSMERERSKLEERLRRIAAARAAAAAAARAAAAAAARRSALQRSADPGLAGSSSNLTGGGFLSPPVHDTYITSPYGMRLHPILHIWRLHDGTDFHADCGTPVYAAADGRVLSEYYAGAYGNRLTIDHGLVRGISLATSYSHLTSFVADPGEQVERGQLIAYSGTTGLSTGCHLHFMVYENGATVDPLTWL